MIQIPLTRGKVALIDEQDIDLISAHNWRFDPGRRSHCGYAKGRVNGKTTYMHRLIVGAQSGQLVDHVNRNLLDNRRSNLRLATRSNNSTNAVKHPSLTGYRGVHFWNGKFRAQLGANRIIHHGSWRANAIDAALDYDDLARKHHGDFAITNFPAGESA